MLTSCCLTAVSLALAVTDAPLVLNETKQLFLDDALIESATGLVRKVHTAEKYEGNPVFWPSESWELPVALLYGSVLQDEGRYRMWYHNGRGVGYAESHDGIQWTKPRMDWVRIEGQPTNGVVLRGATEGVNALPNFYECFGVFKDARETDPQRRYKMGFLSIERGYSGPRMDPYHRGQRRGLGVAASPDGLRWTLLDNWTTEAICDGGTHWMFDPQKQKYVLYGRTKYTSPEVAELWKDDPWFQRYYWGRAVARVESPDFERWDIVDPAKAPIVMLADTSDPVGTEIYSMSVFPYESIYIGLVQIFHNRADAGYLDIQLAVSRDGVDFTRVGDRSAFIPLGGVGEWDRFNTSVANNPLLVDGDEIRFYYSGRTYRHSPYQGDDKGRRGSGIGFATVKRDRFVSLGASYSGGGLLTRPLTLAGKKLHLNVQSDFGEARVTALNAQGEIVARSKPIQRDGLDVPVEWERGSIESIQEPVRLQISLENALLFALWCTE